MSENAGMREAIELNYDYQRDHAIGEARTLIKSIPDSVWQPFKGRHKPGSYVGVEVVPIRISGDFRDPLGEETIVISIDGKGKGPVSGLDLTQTNWMIEGSDYGISWLVGREPLVLDEGMWNDRVLTNAWGYTQSAIKAVRNGEVEIIPPTM